MKPFLLESSFSKGYSSHSRNQRASSKCDEEPGSDQVGCRTGIAAMAIGSQPRI
jgi:hypothetical protein